MAEKENHKERLNEIANGIEAGDDMKFTVEETNLMCIYGIQSRQGLY